MPDADRLPVPDDQPAAEGKGVDGYVLEDQIGHVMRRAFQRHAAIFAEGIEPSGLTPMQFAVMVKLYELGPQSQNHVGRLAAMDAATMMGVIRRLLERGWVARTPDPAHARRLLLTLTEDGEAVIRKALAAARRITAETLAPLSEEERGVLLGLLKRLT